MAVLGGDALVGPEQAELERSVVLVERDQNLLAVGRERMRIQEDRHRASQGLPGPALPVDSDQARRAA
jgi:hypothetical protein